MAYNSIKPKGDLVAFFSGIAGALLVLLVIALIIMWRNPGFGAALLSDAHLIVRAAEVVNPASRSALESLIASGVVVQPERFYTVTVKFYETVIVILLSLLGLLSVFFAYYNRAISRARAEEVAEQGGREAIEKYLRNREFQADFQQKIENLIETHFSLRLKEVEETLEDYGATKEIVERIQDRLGLQDADEQEGADEEL